MISCITLADSSSRSAAVSAKSPNGEQPRAAAKINTFFIPISSCNIIARDLQPHAADGFDTAHQVRTGLLGRDVATRHYRQVAAVEAQIAQHHADRFVLHLDEMLRVEADGGRGAGL